MSTIIRVAGLFVIFTLTACDVTSSANNSVEVAKESSQTASSSHVVFFPDGGGVAFPKPPVAEQEGFGWKYNEFIVDSDWGALKSAIKDTMQEQGYVSHEPIDLQGFEYGLSFSKKGSQKKVSYRAKIINSAKGGKILVRLSWSV